MRRAVELAARGRGSALPNPVVGCVVMDAAGRTVGEGWHALPGGPHAEVVALATAGPRARGGTAVVTLEPCTHTGRTGPCTRALLEAGISRVVVGVSDPYAPAAGGAAQLSAAGAGVEWVDGAEQNAAEAVNAVWLTAVRRGRPYVTWKVASTVDGRVAAADGSSRWITGREARADVHRLRAQADAVLAGVGTVLADDPLLDVRPYLDTPAGHQPLRVIVDSHARTPLTARALAGDRPALVATLPLLEDPGYP
ncbi:MAG: bifunctional diaminohydroxyphosphoribosylaminopyrimidine deaminase/5-amino-6-(5-phosphoribosylamino)uracil reductase RibD, partial [Actinomycetota bacterium]|nr:bifunctional diaminohydroxyphosphoribosylaminopyrimidine deaminase/5-amino-6-(5-phosphoribosylamino)uracil reductase RibD [Actinomycetota bacterium]